MTPKRLKRNISVLDVISKAPSKQREAILNTATRDQISCICDCCNNILNNNITLSSEELRKLKRYKDFVRYLSDTRGQREFKRKREFLVQSGGFLPVLLAPILGALGSILAETLINKK